MVTAKYKLNTWRYRGYYKVARRYEIFLWVLKNNQHAKGNFVSLSDHVMFYLSYKHQWNTKPFFGLKGTVYYEAIATVIFSHVKIFSFSAKAHLVFHWCFYNKSISLNGYGKRNVCPFLFPSRHVSSRKVTFSRVPYKKNHELKINHKERLAAINHRRAVRIKFRGQSIFFSRWRCREVIWQLGTRLVVAVVKRL